MGNKPISDADRALFLEQTAGVKRLQHDRVTPFKAKHSTRPHQRERDDNEVIDNLLSDAYEADDLPTGEELYFHRNGLQKSVLRKFRRGQYSIQAELDLHGLTVEEARQELTAFIHYASSHRLRCVRIIHGKGKRSAGGVSVLKDKVNHWLRQINNVLAFSSARRVDGGTGAVYVLLRTSR